MDSCSTDHCRHRSQLIFLLQRTFKLITISRYSSRQRNTSALANNLTEIDEKLTTKTRRKINMLCNTVLGRQRSHRRESTKQRRRKNASIFGSEISIEWHHTFHNECLPPRGFYQTSALRRCLHPQQVRIHLFSWTHLLPQSRTPSQSQRSLSFNTPSTQILMKVPFAHLLPAYCHPPEDTSLLGFFEPQVCKMF